MTPGNDNINEAAANQSQLNKAIAEMLELKARESMRNVYANHVSFEQTDVDIKVLFGQVDQRRGRSVDWHTGVTMAWPEALMAHFYFTVNLMLYEETKEKIRVPVSMIPSEFAKPDDYETNPNAKRFFDKVEEYRLKFVQQQLALAMGTAVKE